MSQHNPTDSVAPEGDEGPQCEDCGSAGVPTGAEAEGDARARLRALRDAIMRSPANFQAVVALGALAMAEAQGKIVRGAHARRQAMLAMGQGLRSAGYAPAVSTLGLLFSEMRAVGLIEVDRARPASGGKGAILEVRMARPKKGGVRRVTEARFAIPWGTEDVETFSVLTLAQTPTPDGNDAGPQDPDLATACEERDEEMALIAEETRALAPTQSEALDSRRAVTPRPPPFRCFWADEGGDAFET